MKEIEKEEKFTKRFRSLSPSEEELRKKANLGEQIKNWNLAEDLNKKDQVKWSEWIEAEYKRLGWKFNKLERKQLEEGYLGDILIIFLAQFAKEEGFYKDGEFSIDLVRLTNLYQKMVRELS